MRKPKLKQILVVIGLFFFFLLVFFPWQNLKGIVFAKVYAATRILLVADDMSISLFPLPSVTLSNVNVTIPIGDAEIELASEKLGLRIGMASYFPPNFGISMNLKKLKKGGDLFMNTGQSGNTVSLKLDASSVNLEQLSLPGLTRPLLGTVGSDANLRIDQADLSKSTGTITMKGENLKTPGQMVDVMPGMSFAIPGLAIGKFDGQINLKKGVMDFANFKLGDAQSDLSGTVAGDIKLGQDLNRSQVNIMVRLKLAQKILNDPQNKTFVSFLEGYQTSPGEYGLKWNAMVAELSGLSIKVLPEKLN